MADVTVKRIEDFDSMGHEGLSMHTVRSGLGVSSFGIQVIRIPPGNDAYPEHDHSPEGIGGQMFETRPEQLDQEEVYTVLEGSGDAAGRRAGARAGAGDLRPGRAGRNPQDRHRDGGRHGAGAGRDSRQAVRPDDWL